MQQICRRTPIPKCYFNKTESLTYFRRQLSEGVLRKYCFEMLFSIFCISLGCTCERQFLYFMPIVVKDSRKQEKHYCYVTHPFKHNQHQMLARMLYSRLEQWFLQKQPYRDVLSKRCSENMQQFCRRTPMLKCKSIKLLCNFCKITFRYGCSSVNLLHVFRKPFSKNTSEGMFLFFISSLSALNKF